MVSKGRIGYQVSIIAGIAGLMVLAVAAAKAPAAELGDVTVRYADLDVGTAKGAERLYARIKSAAQQVCPGEESQDLSRHMASLRCQKIVVAHSVAAVRSPQLAAVYADRVRHGAV